jgi:hypothetical protein
VPGSEPVRSKGYVWQQLNMTPRPALVRFGLHSSKNAFL